jgi:hypothetical protein
MLNFFKSKAITEEEITAMHKEVRTVIESLTFVRRPSDEDEGPRVCVMGLRGSFWFSQEEAEARIRKEWPRLDDEGVHGALRYLAARLRVATATPYNATRRGNNWVQGWKNDPVEHGDVQHGW